MTEVNEKDPADKGEVRPEVQRFRVEGGALLIWKPSKHGNRDVPCVTVGHFKNGVPAINFRKHSIRSPFLLSATQEGISLSFLELDSIMERLHALANVLVAGEHEGGGNDVAA